MKTNRLNIQSTKQRIRLIHQVYDLLCFNVARGNLAEVAYELASAIYENRVLQVMLNSHRNHRSAIASKYVALQEQYAALLDDHKQLLVKVRKYESIHEETVNPHICNTFLPRKTLH